MLNISHPTPKKPSNKTLLLSAKASHVLSHTKYFGPELPLFTSCYKFRARFVVSKLDSIYDLRKGIILARHQPDPSTVGAKSVCYISVMVTSDIWRLVHIEARLGTSVKPLFCSFYPIPFPPTGRFEEKQSGIIRGHNENLLKSILADAKSLFLSIPILSTILMYSALVNKKVSSVNNF